ncbi:NlpD protein [[Mannheimia] succiniciproducens MBEL55E]|uniref:NlpD protein n=1 Tax=Mannheimia succiniciproducens (strain KCTC 0769BP / MBEL55E) TaxID=221988 RepID=Q65Q84_MANSM|nr:NlpD protein [[Mannheimia] succiniciproducens MBEL55E]
MVTVLQTVLVCGAAGVWTAGCVFTAGVVAVFPTAVAGAVAAGIVGWLATGLSIPAGMELCWISGCHEPLLPVLSTGCIIPGLNVPSAFSTGAGEVLELQADNTATAIGNNKNDFFILNSLKKLFHTIRHTLLFDFRHKTAACNRSGTFHRNHNTVR